MRRTLALFPVAIVVAGCGDSDAASGTAAPPCDNDADCSGGSCVGGECVSPSTNAVGPNGGTGGGGASDVGNGGSGASDVGNGTGGSPPETTIDNGPTGPVTLATAELTFSCDQAAYTYECRTDAGDWSPCASPHTSFDNLDGDHTFEVRAVNSARTVDPTPAVASFRVELSPWRMIAGGPSGTCGIKENDKLYCWGSLGFAETTSRPAEVEGGPWSTVDGGSGRACALTTAGELRCWGGTDVAPDGMGIEWASIAVGMSLLWSPNGLCGIDASGRLFCTTEEGVPEQVGIETDWAQIDAGQDHRCAVWTTGALYCWGSGSDGQLGLGPPPATATRTSPVQVGTSLDWKTVSLGTAQSCAIKTDGRLFCWGDNYKQQSAESADYAIFSPTQVGTAFDWISVAPGYRSTCGARATGDVYCWGANQRGQLGDGTVVDRSTPAEIDADWAAVSVGTYHACALDAAGRSSCWGADGVGQLGAAAILWQPTPTRVGTATNWQTPSMSEDTVCGVRGESDLWCWDRVVGVGEFVGLTQIGSDTDWSDVSPPSAARCATKTDGTLHCWGAHGLPAAKAPLGGSRRSRRRSREDRSG